jgi:hypothetical protein
MNLMTAFYFVAAVLHLVSGQIPATPIFNSDKCEGKEGGIIGGHLVISGLSSEGLILSGSLKYEIQAFDELAKYDADYSFQSGANNTEVTFSPGNDSSSSFIINLHKDNLHENNENFMLNFTFKEATGDFIGAFDYQNSATNQDCTIEDVDSQYTYDEFEIS